MTGNRMRDNLILNKWEFTHGKTVLKSYPWQFSVPFVLCNARCEFCAAWHMKGKAPLLDFMQALTPVIQRSVDIGLVGWGEPLIHPEFAEILQLIKDEARSEGSYCADHQWRQVGRVGGPPTRSQRYGLRN